MDDQMKKDRLLNIGSTDEWESRDLSLKHLLSRRRALQTGAGALIIATGAGAFLNLHRSPTFAASAPPTGTPNAVIQWNNTALDAIRVTSPVPTIAWRVLAIMHKCKYNACATYDPHDNAIRLNNIPRRKPQRDVTQAVSYA